LLVFFHAIFLSNILQLVVNITELLIESLVVLDLCLARDVVSHLSVPRFSNDLSLTNVATTGHLSSLLRAIAHKHARVSLGF